MIIKNSNRHKNGIRYDESLKKFATFLFVTGGRFLYETLALNLPIPSPRTVTRCLEKEQTIISEGKLRVIELKKFLTDRKLPNWVWLSEDGSGIVKKIQYDQKTNQLVGFVLHEDQITGLPKPNSYEAKNASSIQQAFTDGKMANLVYTIMAQPVHPNSPSFCLCVFGTDNKFTSETVLKRWRFIRKELLEAGINVLGKNFVIIIDYI